MPSNKDPKYQSITPVGYEQLLEYFQETPSADESLVDRLNIEQMFVLIDGVLPIEACLYYQVLPLFLEGSRLNLGMVSPGDTAATEYVRRIVSYLNYSLVSRQISSDALRASLTAYLRYTDEKSKTQALPELSAASRRAKRLSDRENAPQTVDATAQPTLVVDSPEALNFSDINLADLEDDSNSSSDEHSYSKDWEVDDVSTITIGLFDEELPELETVDLETIDLETVDLPSLSPDVSDGGQNTSNDLSKDEPSASASGQQVIFSANSEQTIQISSDSEEPDSEQADLEQADSASTTSKQVEFDPFFNPFDLSSSRTENHGNDPGIGNGMAIDGSQLDADAPPFSEPLASDELTPNQTELNDINHVLSQKIRDPEANPSAVISEQQASNEQPEQEQPQTPSEQQTDGNLGRSPLPSNVPPVGLLRSPVSLELKSRDIAIELNALKTLAADELLQELLIRVLDQGIGRLYFERQGAIGRILWSENGVLQSIVEDLNDEHFTQVIEELKHLTHLPLHITDKPLQVELERMYRNERLLLRFRFIPTNAGEEATLQVLRGAALRFYQQQQLSKLSRDALSTAQVLQNKVNALRDRMLAASDVSDSSSNVFPALAQMIDQIEAQLDVLRQPQSNISDQDRSPSQQVSDES